MKRLLLVRHSLPEALPEVPANQWQLSEEGRTLCVPLADRLAEYSPDLIVSSNEPKAVETGRIVSNILGLPFHTFEGLHEHDRSGVGWIESAEDFEDMVRKFFDGPQSLVFGNETADEAHDRFKSAVISIIKKWKDSNIAVVAHGTVITLFIARAAAVAPFPIWKRLRMPSFAVFDLPQGELVKIVGSI